MAKLKSQLGDRIQDREDGGQIVVCPVLSWLPLSECNISFYLKNFYL
ncbi:hypothetical protein [Pleurocapsa sp. FMAR1]|nr:hypothetical protein [Pleurocapsa sp. FMAR1]